MKTKIMAAAGIFALLAGMSMYGQQPTINAKIGFSFTVEGKILPPGPYEFRRDAEAKVFRVQGEGTNGALANILTRLAGDMHTTPQDSHLVFDVVDGIYMLSEIWYPGEDGYLVLATKGKHEHKVVNVEY